jgi:hypothetical protein
MSYDFDRFEDALRTRASQFCAPVDGNTNNYVAGYLMSMMKEFYETNPKAAERINDSLRFLEDQIRSDTTYRYSEEEIAALDNSL